MITTELQARKAIEVIASYLGKNILVRKYERKEFFHLFHIEPMSINDKKVNLIMMKDGLVHDIIQFGMGPDGQEILNAIFVFE